MGKCDGETKQQVGREQEVPVRRFTAAHRDMWGNPQLLAAFPPIILILLFFIMVSIPFNPRHLFDPFPPPLVAIASDSVVESVSWFDSLAELLAS